LFNENNRKIKIVMDIKDDGIDNEKVINDHKIQLIRELLEKAEKSGFVENVDRKALLDEIHKIAKNE